jgi:hypothetical protein
LNARLVTDADVVNVATNAYIQPHAAAFADDDIAGYLRAEVDVSGARDAGYHPTVGPNHSKVPLQRRRI